MFDIDTGRVSVLSVDDSVSVWNPERWHAATELGPSPRPRPARAMLER